MKMFYQRITFFMLLCAVIGSIGTCAAATAAQKRLSMIKADKADDLEASKIDDFMNANMRNLKSDELDLLTNPEKRSQALEFIKTYQPEQKAPAAITGVEKATQAVSKPAWMLSPEQRAAQKTSTTTTQSTGSPVPKPAWMVRTKEQELVNAQREYDQQTAALNAFSGKWTDAGAISSLHAQQAAEERLKKAQQAVDDQVVAVRSLTPTQEAILQEQAIKKFEQDNKGKLTTMSNEEKTAGVAAIKADLVKQEQTKQSQSTAWQKSGQLQEVAATRFDIGQQRVPAAEQSQSTGWQKSGPLQEVPAARFDIGAQRVVTAEQQAAQKEKAATDDLMERALARDRDILRSEITDRPMEPRVAQETIARSAVKAAPAESGWRSAQPTGQRTQEGQMIGTQRFVAADAKVAAEKAAAEKVAAEKAAAYKQSSALVEDYIAKNKALTQQEKIELRRDPEQAVQRYRLDKLFEEKKGLTQGQKIGIGAGVAAAGAGIAALGLGLGLGLGLKDQAGAPAGTTGAAGTSASASGVGAVGGTGTGVALGEGGSGGVATGVAGIVPSSGVPPAAQDVAAMPSGGAGVIVPGAVTTATKEFESGRFEFAREK